VNNSSVLFDSGSRGLQWATMQRHCSVCHAPGHNARTCPNKSQDSRVDSAKDEPAPLRVCSRCHKPGHNVRTCPQDTLEPAVVSEFAVGARPAHLCSQCGKAGHNVRTCPSAAELSEEKGKQPARSADEAVRGTSDSEDDEETLVYPRTGASKARCLGVVDLSGELVCNVVGTSVDHAGWLRFWEAHTKHEYPERCRAKDCERTASRTGGH
jgi:hypothetical protein